MLYVVLMSDDHEKIISAIRRMATNPYRSSQKNKSNYSLNQVFAKPVRYIKSERKEKCKNETNDDEQFGSFEFYEKNYGELKNIERLLGNDPKLFCLYFMNLTPERKQLFMGGSRSEIDINCAKSKNILMSQSTQNRHMLNIVDKYNDCMKVNGGQRSVASLGVLRTQELASDGRPTQLLTQMTPLTLLSERNLSENFRLLHPLIQFSFQKATKSLHSEDEFGQKTRHIKYKKTRHIKYKKSRKQKKCKTRKSPI